LSNTHSPGVELLNQALSLVAAGLHDRAGEVLAQCVRSNPHGYEAVDAMLNNLRHRTWSQAAGEDELRRLDAELAQAHQEKRWDALVPLALRRLTIAPPAAAALLALADTAAAARQPAIEARYIEAADDFSPSDPAVIRRRAQLATRSGRIDEAVALWQQVEQLDPSDSEPAKMVARLTIDQSRARVGLETALCETSLAGSPAAEPADSTDSADDLPRSQLSDGNWQLPCELPHLTAEIKRTPLQQLELAVREYPANGELYLQLASLYLAKGRDYDAERLLVKGREAVPDDLRVRNLWEDVTMLRANARVAAAKQQAETDGTPASRAALAEARAKRDRQEIEIYQQRVKREPDNARLQYQLGLRLHKAGKLNEAAARFEAAMKSPTERPAAAFALGECLQSAGQLAEALRAYRQAAEAAVIPGQTDWRKRALLQAAQLARRVKLLRRARRYTNDLLRINPHDHAAAALLAELNTP